MQFIGSPCAAEPRAKEISGWQQGNVRTLPNLLLQYPRKPRPPPFSYRQHCRQPFSPLPWDKEHDRETASSTAMQRATQAQNAKTPTG